MSLFRIFFLLLTAMLSFQLAAIVIRHDVSDEQYWATEADFPALATLYQIGVHGSLIDPEWVVTAAHAIFCLEPGALIQVGGQQVAVSAVYAHADYQLDKHNDIALVKLQQPVTAVPAARLYRDNDEKGQALWFIGAGASGNGNTGQTVSLQQNNGQLRKAQNTVRSTSATELLFTFNKGDKALPLEGVSGNGDSGGPAFIQQGTDFYLLGVSSRATSWFTAVGKYGVKEAYSRISHHASWLDAVMAENTQAIAEQTTQNRFVPPGTADLPQLCARLNF
ncbi:trypsin-like serine protease [Alkalimonas collagenimarina]|uniref:Trypsin-like serine protease n=1 Tax=Alkalimonas collagenimarina TaxID=400390 RepID=A0ABT9GXZ8_9GAMM|nr:trypsin-like serine protease [Alkalimonas collagenimarina]MDP4535940.1 trypsin-like serine protease [Alkalimonas collagenimarina]